MKNIKLYVSCVDFSRYLDSINRDSLFKILKQNGIDGKLLAAIKIYICVFAEVKVYNNYNRVVWMTLRPKARMSMFPELFTIFMNELSKEMNKHGKHGMQLAPGMQIIFHLLWADGVIQL